MRWLVAPLQVVAGLIRDAVAVRRVNRERGSRLAGLSNEQVDALLAEQRFERLAPPGL